MKRQPLPAPHSTRHLKPLAACWLLLTGPAIAAEATADEAPAPEQQYHRAPALHAAASGSPRIQRGLTRWNNASVPRYPGGASLYRAGWGVIVETRTGVYGVVSGLQSTFVNCRNATNPQAGSHTVPEGTSKKWACEWADVGYASGDEVIVVIGGLGTDSTFWGAVFGMDMNIEVRCENLTRGIKNRFVLNIDLQWSCGSSALEISPGDQVQAIIIGRAEP